MREIYIFQNLLVLDSIEEALAKPTLTKSTLLMQSTLVHLQQRLRALCRNPALHHKQLCK